MWMERRKFIKQTCKSCTALLLLGTGAALFSSCSSLNVVKVTAVQNVLKIPIKNLPPDVTLHIVRDRQLDYDVLLVLHKDKDPGALLMKCTHIDNALVATNAGLACNMHGSRFDLDGKVTNGPATNPLKSFRTQKDENEIKIFLN